MNMLEASLGHIRNHKKVPPTSVIHKKHRTFATKVYERSGETFKKYMKMTSSLVGRQGVTKFIQHNSNRMIITSLV